MKKKGIDGFSQCFSVSLLTGHGQVSAGHHHFGRLVSLSAFMPGVKCVNWWDSRRMPFC